MFIFSRKRTGPAEMYYIYVRAGKARDKKRFGEPFSYGGRRSERYHEVGTVVLIHDDREVECFLACRNSLTEAERQQLRIAVKHLTGKGKCEEYPGSGLAWFERSFFRDETEWDSPELG